jgi:hypothetical protein
MFEVSSALDLGNAGLWIDQAVGVRNRNAATEVTTGSL